MHASGVADEDDLSSQNSKKLGRYRRQVEFPVDDRPDIVDIPLGTPLFYGLHRTYTSTH